jgi:hypothetical protein
MRLYKVKGYRVKVTIKTGNKTFSIIAQFSFNVRFAFLINLVGLKMLLLDQDIWRLNKQGTVAKRLARQFAFGRSRVLTPAQPDVLWVFFSGFPTTSHRGMSTGLISQIRQMLGKYFTPQYLPPSFRTHPHRTHPELPFSVAEKAMESLRRVYFLAPVSSIPINFVISPSRFS